LTYRPTIVTLLADVDYVVNSNNLTQLLNNKNSFFAHNSVCSIHLPEVRQQKFGTKNTDMWWATVVVFDKSNFSKDVFSLWKMLRTTTGIMLIFLDLTAHSLVMIMH
jgi:hypothetical protein